MSTTTWEKEQRREKLKLAGNDRVNSERRLDSLLEPVSIAVVAALSFAIVKITRLYNMTETDLLKAGNSVILAGWFVLNFRIAVHERSPSKPE